MVFFEATAFEIAADDALDGDDASGFADDDAALVVVARFAGGEDAGVERVGVGGEDVGLADAAGGDHGLPEEGELGEQAALAGDGRGHDDVEGADAIAGDDEESRAGAERGCGGGGEWVDVADFAAAGAGEEEAGVGEGGHEESVTEESEK